MNCNEVRDNLVAYIHGELDENAVMTIHLHLGTCELCVQEELDLRKTNRLLDRYHFEALPENFDEQLHKKIQRIENVPGTKKSDFRRIVYAVAATILIIIGIQYFGSRLFQSTRQTIHFKDYPTTQAVFKPADSQPGSELSLKDRFVQRYSQPAQHGKVKIERNE
jgi:anti-sigma factor RsiW